MVQAVGIFSGGLDSLLSVRLLMEQGLMPTLVTFTTPFFPPDKAVAGAEALGLPLIQIDIYDDLLPLIKNPPHGLGKNLNPCIDCHALMFRRAGEVLAASDEAGFLFSGEVVGQRPMSQNPHSLKIVARDSGHWGYVLRPLSAKNLPMTEAEEKGWVDRNRLLGLNGRSRRAQMDLAKSFDLPIPAPAGGCLLTDVGYSKRLKWLLEQGRDISGWPPPRLAEILKRGRLFDSGAGQWLCVGRNQADNDALASLAEEGDVIFHLEGAPGPLVLLPGGKATPAAITMGCDLAASYGDHGDATVTMVRVEIKGQGDTSLEKAEVRPPTFWLDFMVPKN